MSKKRIEKLINIQVGNIVENLFNSAPKELHVYDFDDTLIASDAVAYVKNKKTGLSRELHPHEFHEYVLAADEQFDLSEFDKLHSPRLLPHFQKLADDYARLGPQNVAILTARPNPGPVQKFLDSHGLTGIEVEAVGEPSPSTAVKDLNAARKKEWLKAQIENRDLAHLSFYDDNTANIDAAKELEYEHPDVTFTIELVV